MNMGKKKTVHVLSVNVDDSKFKYGDDQYRLDIKIKIMFGVRRDGKNAHNSHRRKVVKSISRLLISLVAHDDENLESFLEELEERGSSSEAKRGKHFIDRIMKSKILQKASSIETKEVNENVDKDKLSLPKLATNFQALAKKLNIINMLINEIHDIGKWKHADKTLTVLLLYTWMCIYPYFLLICPIVFAAGYMCYQYTYRHPLINKPSCSTRDKSLEKVWELGCGERLKQVRSERLPNRGLFGFLLDGSDEEEGMQANGDEERERFDEGDAREIFRDVEVSGMFEEYEKMIEKEGNERDGTRENTFDLEEHFESTYHNHILESLLEIQTLTGQILDSVERGERFIEECCSFQNEKVSTVLLYKLLLIVVIVFVLGDYINWKLITITLPWIVLGTIHPMGKVFFRLLTVEGGNNNSNHEGKKRKPYGEHVVEERHENNILDEYLESLVLIDESVTAREVYIYEIERLDPVKGYMAFGYSDTAFDKNDYVRRRREMPLMVSNIVDVQPPEGWVFLNGEEWRASSGGRWEYDVGTVMAPSVFRRRVWKRRVITTKF